MPEPHHQAVRWPTVVAHRAGNHPTSALRALRRVTMIEVDAHVFRGRVEVRHEKVLWPSSRLWERWYLLPRNTRVTEIGEMLNAVPADTALLLDLKCFTTRAARRIRDAVPEHYPVVVSSRAWWILGVFRHRPNAILLRSCGSGWQLRLAKLLPGLDDRVGVVAHHDVLDKETIAAVTSKTPLLYCWAVPTAERGRALAEAGVAGLIVDDLELDWPGLG